MTTPFFREPQKNNPFYAANRVDLATVTIGAQVSRTRNVAVQLADPNNNAPNFRVHVEAYLSDDADGHTVVASAPDGAVVIGTNGLLLPRVADKVFGFVTDALGRFDFNFVNSTAKTAYLVLRMPDGRIQVSAAIVLA
jgi:hypothetical protein